MLNAHIDSVERMLLAKSGIAKNSGHPIHKGTPRELFIREFLGSHLGNRVAFGTGEIIEGKSRPGQKRNQIDIVIYKADYPKLDFGGGISAFLAESVIATIEVKSKITKKELSKTVITAKKIKALDRGFQTITNGLKPKSIRCYVVGYDGPKKMRTVYQWSKSIHSAENITFPKMPSTIQVRSAFDSPTIDGIFVLGKGFMQFDNATVIFRHDPDRKKKPDHCWTWHDAKTGALLVLFTLLTQAASEPTTAWLDAFKYIDTVKMPIGETGP